MDNAKEIASKGEREQLKKRAVEVRESGNLVEAEKLFKQVTEWDETNDNFQGEVDALGHLRIIYTKLAEEENDPQKKQALRERAKGSVEKALAILETHPEIPQGPRPITQVHLASTILDLARETTDTNLKTQHLERALQTIVKAMETLPGSQAHQAWPANIQAQILYELGRKEDAWNVLLKAEKWIYDGYEAELTNGDQAEIKLDVWISGLMLTKAEICRRENKAILARHYAEYVLNMSDSQGSLGQRKKDAKALMSKLD